MVRGGKRPHRLRHVQSLPGAGVQDMDADFVVIEPREMWPYCAQFSPTYCLYAARKWGLYGAESSPRRRSSRATDG